MPPTELPWAGHWPWSRRCRAVREPQLLPGPADDPHLGLVADFYGRCDLRPHGPEIDHALERGFDTPRWSTGWTDTLPKRLRPRRVPDDEDQIGNLFEMFGRPNLPYDPDPTA